MGEESVCALPIYGITCSALETVQRQTNGIISAELLQAPETQKDDGTQLHFKRCPGLWLVPYKSSHSINKAVSCKCRLLGMFLVLSRHLVNISYVEIELISLGRNWS